MNNFKDKLNNFFFLDDEEGISGVDETTEVREEVKPTPTYEEQAEPDNVAPVVKSEKRVRQQSRGENVVAINQKQALQKPQITIVEPRLYSEVQEVSDYLLGSQSVIVNFRRMDHEQATKMIDFLMGVTYAVKGDIQRLGDEIFICTPQSVTVNGSDLSEFTDSLL